MISAEALGSWKPTTKSCPICCSRVIPALSLDMLADLPSPNSVSTGCWSSGPDAAWHDVYCRARRAKGWLIDGHDWPDGSAAANAAQRLRPEIGLVDQ